MTTADLTLASRPLGCHTSMCIRTRRLLLLSMPVPGIFVNLPVREVIPSAGVFSLKVSATQNTKYNTPPRPQLALLHYIIMSLPKIIPAAGYGKKLTGHKQTRFVFVMVAETTKNPLVWISLGPLENEATCRVFQFSGKGLP